MTDNARHVPGSTRSCGGIASISFPFFLGSLLIPLGPENPSKTSPKSDRFRECEFFNCSASTAYNFTPIKRSDFCRAVSLLTVDNQSLGDESHNPRLKRPADCYSFSLGEKVRMREKPVRLYGPLKHDNLLSNTVQNGTKRDDIRFSQQTATSYQRLASTPRSVVPFSKRGILGGQAPVQSPDPSGSSPASFLGLGISLGFGFWCLGFRRQALGTRLSTTPPIY